MEKPNVNPQHCEQTQLLFSVCAHSSVQISNHVMLGGNRLEEIDEERQKSLKLNEAGVGLVRSLIMTQSDLSG